MIHRVGGRRQVAQRVDAEYASHWLDDRKIRKEIWGQFMAAAMIGKTTPDEVRDAAVLADHAYIEMMLREKGRFGDSD
jgi:hypothetical protein